MLAHGEGQEMQMRKCIQCEKPLPADCVGDKCSLCAIGLVPTTPLSDELSSYQSPIQVEGRQLSGVECPNCQAELTVADLGHRSCAICGVRFSVERADMLRRGQRVAQLPQGIIETTLGDTRWPEDAPLR